MDKNKQELAQIRQKYLAETKKRIKESVTTDTLVTQVISLLDELDKIINQISMRLREWYEWHNPEFSRAIPDNEKFAEIILQKDKKTLLKELNITQSMGADLNKEDIDAILQLAKQAEELIHLRNKQREYLEQLLGRSCPRALVLLGTTITARLVSHAGSIRKLAMTPSSVIQIMGAEKALFRHMLTKARTPKYGYLFSHPLIGTVPKQHRGKMARAIADKAALAFRADFFNGSTTGESLKLQLDKKVTQLMNQKVKIIEEKEEYRLSYSRKYR